MYVCMYIYIIYGFTLIVQKSRGAYKLLGAYALTLIWFVCWHGIRGENERNNKPYLFSDHFLEVTFAGMY